MLVANLWGLRPAGRRSQAGHGFAAMPRAGHEFAVMAHEFARLVRLRMLPDFLLQPRVLRS